MSDPHEHVAFVAPDPSELAPLFPGYEIKSLIATGGMGAVYSAVQKSLDRMVALKILPVEFSSDAAFCAGFEAEAKAMARLNHANLIGVYDFGEVNGMLYIMMEFVPGKSVYHATYGTVVPPAEAIRLVSAVCHGLAHAHENGIIHRDIKPSNILLDLNSQPKIGDFGLARPAERKIEEGEEIFGTPHYTAPEVVNAPHTVDHRADIFSVGVMLHELITGKLPAADPRTASAIVRCDSRFDAIIRKATQPLAAARYSSAAEMAADLQAIANTVQRPGPVVSPMAAPRRPKAGRTYTSTQKQSSGSGSAFLLLAGLAIAGGVAYFFISKKPEPAPAPPTAEIEVPQAKEEAPVAAPTRPNTTRPTQPRPKDTAQSGSGTSSPFGSTEPPTVAPAANTTLNIPDQVASVTPKFDVDGFFDRARKIMQDRSKSQVGSYRNSVKNNFSDFRNSIDKQTRRMRLSGTRVDDRLATTMLDMEKKGGRIPKDLSSIFKDVPGIDSIHQGSYSRQIGIDDTFHQSMSSLASTYILGLEKQIERIDAEDDPGAVELIQKEIERTKASLSHFPKLMLGEDPDAEEDDY